MFPGQQFRYQYDGRSDGGADANANPYFFRYRTRHIIHLPLFVGVIRDDIFKLQDAIGIWQSLHISQSSVHHAGSGPRQDFQLFAGFIYLVLGFSQDLLKFLKFVLYYAEDFPHFMLRRWIAIVRKDICRLLSKAAIVLGPAILTGIPFAGPPASPSARLLRKALP